MKNTLETRLGIFVALAVIAAVLIMDTLGGIELFKRGYHLHADFKNVQELKVGDRVKMGGVENLTKSFSGDKIDNLLGPFTDFIRANQVPLTATIANIQVISSQISQGKGTVGKLINDDTLYNSALSSVTNLQDVAAEIKGT